MGKVQCVGQVEDDLALEVLGAGGRQSTERRHSGGRIDDQVGMLGGGGEGRQRDPGVLRLPDAERRGPQLARRGASAGRLRITRADGHVVVKLVQPAGQGLTDHACAQNGDLHGAVSPSRG